MGALGAARWVLYQSMEGHHDRGNLTPGNEGRPDEPRMSPMPQARTGLPSSNLGQWGVAQRGLVLLSLCCP